MIGDRIKEARLSLGYSAEQVAAFLQVSPATVYRYENGDISKLPSKFIKPLAEFLCVSPEYLMGWTDEKPSPSAEQPKNDDVRVFVRGLNKLTPEQISQGKSIFEAVFGAGIFDAIEKGDDDK